MRNAPNHNTLDMLAKWPTNKTMLYFSFHTFNTWNTTILSVQYINVSPFNWWYEKEQKKAILYSVQHPNGKYNNKWVVKQKVKHKLKVFFFSY